MTSGRVLKPITDKNGVSTSRWVRDGASSAVPERAGAAPRLALAEPLVSDFARPALSAMRCSPGTLLDLRDPSAVAALASTITESRLYHPDVALTPQAQEAEVRAAIERFALSDEDAAGAAPAASLAEDLADGGYVQVQRDPAVGALLDRDPSPDAVWSELVYGRGEGGELVTAAAATDEDGVPFALAVAHEGRLAYAVGDEDASEAIAALPVPRDLIEEEVYEAIFETGTIRSADAMTSLTETALSTISERPGIASLPRNEVARELVGPITKAFEPWNPYGGEAEPWMIAKAVVDTLPAPATAVRVPNHLGGESTAYTLSPDSWNPGADELLGAAVVERASHAAAERRRRR